jgi:hypothetical protein
MNIFTYLDIGPISAPQSKASPAPPAPETKPDDPGKKPETPPAPEPDGKKGSSLFAQQLFFPLTEYLKRVFALCVTARTQTRRMTAQANGGLWGSDYEIRPAG